MGARAHTLLCLRACLVYWTMLYLTMPQSNRSAPSPNRQSPLNTASPPLRLVLLLNDRGTDTRAPSKSNVMVIYVSYCCSRADFSDTLIVSFVSCRPSSSSSSVFLICVCIQLAITERMKGSTNASELSLTFIQLRTLSARSRMTRCSKW